MHGVHGADARDVDGEPADMMSKLGGPNVDMEVTQLCGGFGR